MRSAAFRKRLSVVLASLLTVWVNVHACPRSAEESGDAVRHFAATGSARQSLRVLFIGNSYTYFNNLPALLSSLSASDPSGARIEAEMVTHSGATLRQHWENGEALAKLNQGHWDFVVLQEQSTLPIIDPQTMYRYARLFDGEIKRVGARTVFLLTWARQNRPETQAALNQAYLKIARELGAPVAPVGIAWQRARKLNARFLLYMTDQSHPNASGSYLAACVLYSVIVGHSPDRLAGTLMGRPVTAQGAVGTQSVELVKLSDEEAHTLQKIAWETTSDLPGNR
jgi:hypothetical protein